MQGTRTDVTGVDGIYRFSAIPPGEYRVTYELGGFETQIREAPGESRGPPAQLDEAEAHSVVDDRLAFRVTLGRVLEAAGKVHELPATSAIASTIGS